MISPGQRLRKFLLIVIFADLMVVAARISLPLPPVPLTMQTGLALLSGALLGSRVGSLSQVLYILMGLAGLPVFASGGGLSYVFSPTFGYLAGFVAGAWMTGLILERRPTKNFWAVSGAMLTGLTCIYLLGLPYLYFNLRIVQEKDLPVAAILKAGLFLPLPGDLVKIAVASAAALALQPLINGFADVGRRE